MRTRSISARRITIWLAFSAVIYLVGPAQSVAQVNVSGKPGLLYIPTARILDDGAVCAGATYNPIRYAFRFNSTRSRSSETIYFVNLVLLPRLEVNLNLLIPNETVDFQDRGIGDRQIDIKYGLLTETKKRPAVALILSAPFGIDNSLETYALVATKNMPLTKAITAEVTVGMGSPYYVYRDVKNDKNSGIFSGFTLLDKRSKTNSYLAGPFAGLSLHLKKRVGLLLEWDSQHLNVGAFATLWKHWTVQGGLLNGDQVTLGSSYQFSLLRPSKRLEPAAP